MCSRVEANRGKPTYLFMHHNVVPSFPEYPLGRQGDSNLYLIDNAAEHEKLLAKHPQVKGVVSAHYHFSDAQVQDGVAYVTTPSIQTYPCRYAVIEVGPKALNDLDNPNHCTQTAIFEMKQYPPVVPIVNLLLGFRFNLGDKFSLNIEGGWRMPSFFVGGGFCSFF